MTHAKKVSRAYFLPGSIGKPAASTPYRHSEYFRRNPFLRVAHPAIDLFHLNI